MPTEIYTREGKGTATKFTSNQVIDNLPFFREFILDGHLVKTGLLDKTTLEKKLNEDEIKVGLVGGYIMKILRLEKWLRNTKNNKRLLNLRQAG